jgi:spore germination protein GerM
MSGLAKTLMVVLLVVLAASVLYLRGLGRRLFFEGSQRAEETGVRTRLTEAALQSASGPRQTARLYFPAYETGTLFAENRPVTWAATDSDRIRQVLLGLIEGSREGHSAALPPSTTVRAVFLTSDGTAYVDFSNDLLAGLSPGMESESLAVYSIVNSLAANVPAVKKVWILIQGQEADTLGGHADLSEPFAPDLTRNAPAP